MITIRQIAQSFAQDINIPNQPFPLFGRMIPAYTDGLWSHKTELFPKDACSSMCFPDENYDYSALSQNSYFLGAYDGDTCIGLAILQRGWLKYMYLYDLKVNAAYRGRHIGTQLIDAAKKLAAAQGYRGLYTIGQDNNLAACLFYLRNGFVIGGLDTHVYTGTSQEGKKDIVFYWDH